MPTRESIALTPFISISHTPTWGQRLIAPHRSFRDIPTGHVLLASSHTQRKMGGGFGTGMVCLAFWRPNLDAIINCQITNCVRFAHQLWPEALKHSWHCKSTNAGYAHTCYTVTQMHREKYV